MSKDQSGRLIYLSLLLLKLNPAKRLIQALTQLKK
ncbi:MAG: hypothetical protein UT84_C0035G0006 [Candidatus Curtissbacteria bacterium GW2011_GWA1_40_16]|uniref:Uncharacterized protein n=1 Tax=Candidatus Curtissbacteria bacterium GW2011_GWA1_40_16 TaxID=1618405 RepID=A0A0G0TP38_9BACT|nr:MAG: hypothetical protein UT84_C0035G0006 [Candidatus Curtissbacteria bacterium GW2011_GWA1_40_16]